MFSDVLREIMQENEISIVLLHVVKMRLYLEYYKQRVGR